VSTKVKICGLSTPQTMQVALDAGADFVGLVVFPPSPRNVSLEQGAMLAHMARGRAAIVALLVDADDGLIGEVVAQIRPDFLQLHGDETPERVAAVRARWTIPVIKALKVATRDDACAALAYRGTADLILFDAKPPPEATRPGGHGAVFDWALLDAVTPELGAFMLSGGLEPGNVAAAIAATGAPMVDVSSGVEVRRGEKSPGLIRRFLRAAKGL
jgi:phosphoribosylanthranilate isomerase